MHFQFIKSSERLFSFGVLFVSLCLAPRFIYARSSGDPSLRTSSRSGILKTSNSTVQAMTTATYPRWLSLFNKNSSSPSHSQPSPAFSTIFGGLNMTSPSISSGQAGFNSTGFTSPTVISSSSKDVTISASTMRQSSHTNPTANSTSPLVSIASSNKTFSYSSMASAIAAPSHSGSLLANSSLSAAASSYSESRGQLQSTGQVMPSVSQTSSSLGRLSASSGPTKTSSNTPVVSEFYEILPGGVTTSYSITTTITSPPPGFSTFLASNSSWTGDTTTVSDDTTYPVIFGCAKCTGSHQGLVIMGLGGKTSDPGRTGCGSGIFRSIFGCGTEFNFPPIWGITPFIIDPLGDPVPLAPEPEADPNSDQDPDQTSNPKSDEPSFSRASSTAASSASASSISDRASLSRASSNSTSSASASSISDGPSLARASSNSTS